MENTLWCDLTGADVTGFFDQHDRHLIRILDKTSNLSLEDSPIRYFISESCGSDDEANTFSEEDPSVAGMKPLSLRLFNQMAGPDNA